MRAMSASCYLPISFFVLVACLATNARAQLPNDPCMQYDDCEICVSHDYCGWCSTDVIYQGNVTGKRCAGRSSNSTDRFECNGIFSIEQCTVGYVCDLDNFQCKQAGAGNGTTQQKCEANCSNMGQVYVCNTTSETCHQVSSGTPGASSYQVCESSCKHPKSAQPASSHPETPAPPAPVYKCDGASGTCVNATAGEGTSLEVCMQQCTKSTNETLYFCNSIMHQCEKAPTGFPGENKTQCEAECVIKPNPGPPTNLLGLWRAIQIQNGYATGEFDIQITQSSFIMVDINGASTIKGTPYNVQKDSEDDLWVKITAGTGAGKTIKAISTNYQRGPETNFRVIAFSAPGGKTPTSIPSAMSASSGDTVYFMMSCVGTPECIFTMPTSQRKPLFQRIRQNKLNIIERRAMEIREFGYEDACSQFSSNCSYCIAHDHCGWCSTDVTYKGGVQGTQCAGWSSDPNATNPWVCEGHFSTLDCTQGWTCNEESLTCEQNAQPGNGFPKTECLEICRPTPSPTPQLEQYVCNMTTHQCHKCNDTAGCAGSMPEAACAAACKHPHKGPTSLVLGVWRGLEIQNNYPLVEWDWVFNSSSLTVYRNGQKQFDADVTSYGGDEMIFDVTSGSGQGSKYSAIYTIADQGQMVEAMTLALSAPNGEIPGGYVSPMQTKGQVEIVLVKCGDSDCKFTAPTA